MTSITRMLAALVIAAVGLSASAATVQVDLNDAGSPTLTGWQGISAADTDLGDSWSKNFTGGIALNIDVLNGVGDNSVLDDRDRTSQGGAGDGSTDMFRDFMFVNGSTAPTEGAELTFTGLQPNKVYPVTAWGWDSASTTDRTTVWSALEGGNLNEKTTYVFDGAGSDPDTLADRNISFAALSDHTGTLTLRAMTPATGANGFHNVFINGIELGDPIRRQFRIDIDSTDVNSGPIETADGWVSLDATGVSNNATVTVNGITFQPFSADGSRIRRSGGAPNPDALLSDFIFDDGDGQAVGLLLGGAGDLPAGEWLVELFSNDAGAQPGEMIAAYRENGTEFIVDTSVLPTATGPAASFIFESDGVSAYDVFLREAPGGNNRTRLNAVRLTFVIPTPAALPAGLAMLGLMTLRRRR